MFVKENLSQGMIVKVEYDVRTMTGWLVVLVGGWVHWQVGWLCWWDGA